MSRAVVFDFIERAELLGRPLRRNTAIDPVEYLEVDDTVNLVPLNRKKLEFHVEVNIANAGLLYGRTDVIDQARAMGWTLYDFDEIGNSIPMLDSDIFGQALGLDCAQETGAPAIEISFDFDMATHAIGNIALTETRVKTAIVSYTEHNALLADTRGRTDAHEAARDRLAVARRLFATPGDLNQIHRDRRSEDVVQYFMLAANRLMASEMSIREIPWLFRNHTREAYETWQNEQQRKILARLMVGYYSNVALGHEGIDAPEYCHFTSPLRRFPDLANHLNLYAHMHGLPIPFDERDIVDIGHEMTALYIARHPQHFPKAV